jgi:hypothetical protein
MNPAITNIKGIPGHSSDAKGLVLSFIGSARKQASKMPTTPKNLIEPFMNSPFDARDETKKHAKRQSQGPRK